MLAGILFKANNKLANSELYQNTSIESFNKNEYNQMKISRFFYIFATVALITGCATDPIKQQKFALQQMEYKLQVYGPACEKLGFEKDTDGWRTCIQREYEQTILRQQSLRNLNNNWHPYNDPFFYRRW